MKNFLTVLFIICAIVLAGAPANQTIDLKIVKNGAAVTRDRFPDADNVLLFEKERYTYQKDGSFRSTDELYAKILTEKGRSGLRQLTFHFNIHYNRIKVDELSVIKSDGKVIPVNVAANSRVVIDSSQMASNIYDPAQKELVVSLPQIEVGDILYLRTTDEHFKPRIPDFWSTYTLLQSSWPIMEAVVEIDAPAELPLRSIALKGEVKGTVKHSQKKEKERILYTWHALNVPQALHEPGMPELHTCVQRLLVSTARSWEEVSRWYWNLCLPRLSAVTPAMKETVGKLVKGKKKDLEKVRALFQFVSQNIRYMGITPEKEAPGYEPHDVKLTFEQRYGVCRDKAALLAAMLQMAGLKAYPVLFMAGDPKDPEIPNSYFNHAVTAVELEKDNFLLMDPTYESTVDLFPAFQADMSYLVAHPQGKKLLRSPLVPASANQAKIRTQAELSADNVLTCESVIELSGVNDNYYRGAFSRWSEEKKEQFFLGRLRKVLPGASLEKMTVLPENIRNMSVPLQFRLRYTVPMGHQQGQYLLQMPELSGVFGIGEAVFQDVGLLKRKYPLKLMTTCLTDELYTVKLPETVKLLTVAPDETFGVKGKISCVQKTLLKENLLQVSKKLSVNTLEITASEYGEFKKFLDKLARSRQNLPVAENHFQLNSFAAALKAFPGANSILENKEVNVTLKDASNWRVRTKSRRKILNYSGVKAHSDVRIAFMDQRTKLLNVTAKVTAPDGSVKLAGKKEINIMDAPRNSTGPRYPAEKIMVINLPGVVPGAVVELDVEKEHFNRPVFSEMFCFADETAPVIRSSVTLDIPENLFIRSRVLQVEKTLFKESRLNGRHIRSWQIEQLPRLKNEYGQPHWAFFVPGVIFSAGNGNQTYAAQVNKALLEKCRESLPEAQALVKKEKWQELKTLAEKVIKVRDHVDKFVRKVPFPLGELPLSSLSRARVTLESGYGNSADRAILTGALLQALGIEFSFAGVSGMGHNVHSNRLLARNAAPEALVEEILLFLPALRCYLNDTGRYAVLGSCRSEGKLALELASGRINRIKTESRHASARKIQMLIQCKENNSGFIQVTEELFGGEYETLKKEFETATPERRRRFFEERASAVGHDCRLLDAGSADFQKYPGILRYKLGKTELLNGSGLFRSLTLPGYQMLRSTAALPVTGKRTTPFWRNSAKQFSLSCTVVLPRGFELLPGRPEKIERSRYGSFSFSERFSKLGDRVRLESRIILPVELVSPADFAGLEEWVKTVSRPEAGTFIFKKSPNNRNVR